MNKILVDGEKLVLDSGNTSLSVNGCATIFINNIDDFSLEVRVLNNSKLEIYDFSTKSINKEIYLIQENNSVVNYVNSFKIKGCYNLKYRVDIKGNNNSNLVYINGVSNGSVTLDVDGSVGNNLKNNVLNEDIKVLTVNGKCFVAPKIRIKALDVLATHNTAISNIRDDELFYLLSKGIDREHAISLIEAGYVYGHIKKYSKEFYDFIKE